MKNKLQYKLSTGNLWWSENVSIQLWLYFYHTTVWLIAFCWAATIRFPLLHKFSDRYPTVGHLPRLFNDISRIPGHFQKFLKCDNSRLTVFGVLGIEVHVAGDFGDDDRFVADFPLQNLILLNRFLFWLFVPRPHLYRDRQEPATCHACHVVTQQVEFGLLRVVPGVVKPKFHLLRHIPTCTREHYCFSVVHHVGTSTARHARQAQHDTFIMICRQCRVTWRNTWNLGFTTPNTTGKLPNSTCCVSTLTTCHDVCRVTLVVRVALCLLKHDGRRKSSSVRVYKFSLLRSGFTSISVTTSGNSEVDMSTTDHVPLRTTCELKFLSANEIITKIFMQQLISTKWVQELLFLKTVEPKLNLHFFLSFFWN